MSTYNRAQLKYANSVLPSLSIQEAQEKQFKLVDSMSRHFKGRQFLSMGDLGVSPIYKRRNKRILLKEFWLISLKQKTVPLSGEPEQARSAIF